MDDWGTQDRMMVSPRAVARGLQATLPGLLRGRAAGRQVRVHALGRPHHRHRRRPDRGRRAGAEQPGDVHGRRRIGRAVSRPHHVLGRNRSAGGAAARVSGGREGRGPRDARASLRERRGDRVSASSGRGHAPTTCSKSFARGATWTGSGPETAGFPLRVERSRLRWLERRSSCACRRTSSSAPSCWLGVLHRGPSPRSNRSRGNGEPRPCNRRGRCRPPGTPT